MSWLQPVRRKCERAAAVSAVAAARRGRNGGLLTLAPFQFTWARAATPLIPATPFRSPGQHH